jgi:hypothetical protein
MHKCADVSNCNFHYISWDEIPCWLHGKAYSCRTPRQNRTPSLKSCALAAEGDNLRDVENEVGCVDILTKFSIYFSTYRQIMGVFHDLDTRRKIQWLDNILNFQGSVYLG